MKKITLFLFLLFISFSFVYGANIENSVSKNVANIENTLKKYQTDNNYIDYDYKDVFTGESNNDIIDINLYIKNSKGDIINYNGNVNIEPLYFGNHFTFGEIPKVIKINNGKGNIKIPVTMLNPEPDDISGLGLLLNSQNKDLIGNIVNFASAVNSINIDNYLDKLVVENTKNDIDNLNNNILNNSEYTLYNPERPNIHGNKGFEINENGEFVIEYDKYYYEKLLKVYGGQGILWFDKKSSYKYNVSFKIENKGNSVFITILKDNKIIDIYKYYASINNIINNESSTIIPNAFFGNVSSSLRSDIGMTTKTYEYYDKKLIKLLSELNIKGLGEFYNEYSLDAYETEKIGENSNITYEQFKNNSSFDGGVGYIINSINGNNIRFVISNFGTNLIDKKNNYLENKYKKYYKDLGNNYKVFSFDIIRNEKEIKNFLIDNMYYDLPIRVTKNLGSLYLKKNTNDLYYISPFTKNDLDNLSFSLVLFNGKELDEIDCNIYDKNCNIYDKNIKNIPINYLKENLKYDGENVYVNITNFYDQLIKNQILKGYNFKNISSISVNGDTFDFPYKKEDDILSITSKIASPKDISTNPFLVGLNIFLALLYLFTFYFTAQLFNSYFEELSNKKNWNEKISNFFSKLTILPILQFGRFLNFLYKKIKFNFGIKINNKIGDFLKKYEHKIFIILCFIILGIIGQIVVDDFDIFSLEGWYVIGIMIFVLAFITLFKDMLLYILNKKTEKDNLKIEVIPVGYIVAFIVALFGRTIGMIPGVMFGSVVKVDAKSDATSEKLAKPSLLFKILMTSFTIGVICWLLTILFDSNTFVYKFLMVTYFGLVNDVFFALLPFGMLWGVYILKDKTIKIKWFIFTFIVFLFLLHTIINPEGDLNKILKFDGNFLILVSILFFWILITTISYFYIKPKKA
ncbi:MAG: hypothetical protein PHI37_05275 [Candidatus Gracilibacteria bacterium]|nr:hypothetical protein [Candidatus Gracilibacteria bacterium]